MLTSPLSPKLRDPLGLVVAATAIFWLIALLSFQHFVLRVTFDDSFYYFGIARNLMEGYGFTFDRLNQTNGFHPLWLFTCALPYWFGLNDSFSLTFYSLSRYFLAQPVVSFFSGESRNLPLTLDLHIYPFALWRSSSSARHFSELPSTA